MTYKKQINPQQIIKIIGAKRLATLIFMASMLAIWIAAFFFLVKPMRDDTQNQLNSVKNQVSGLRRRINSVGTDIEYMKQNIPVYESILNQGLFDDQDRFRVVDVVEKMKRDAGVYKFSYNIGNRSVVPSADADRMGYSIIKRSIRLTNVTALLDSDVFSFFQRIPNILPLYVHIKRFRVVRRKDVNINVLQDIANNKENELISADIEFDWVTLSQKDKAESNVKQDQGTGQRGSRR